jgi:hypothetical protein
MEAQSCAFGRGPGLWLLQVAVPLDLAVLDVHVLAGEIRVDDCPELGGELALRGCRAGAEELHGVSPLARECLEQSLREAIRRGDTHLGVEHLVLALVSRTDGGAARTLEQCGTSAETVRHLLEARAAT